MNEKEQILELVAAKEAAFRAEPHSGTACELLNAYQTAANYERTSGAGYDAELSWLKKACEVAEQDVQILPWFASLWDAAMMWNAIAEFSSRNHQLRDALAQYEKAMAYLKRILDEKMESINDACKPEQVLAAITERYQELKNRMN